MLKCAVAAKDVICGLLKTDPDERLTIREVLQSKWVSVCVSVFLITFVLFVFICFGSAANC